MISKYQHYKKIFGKFDYNGKKNKVFAMLGVVKNPGNIFQDLYDVLNLTATPSEWILDIIHDALISTMYAEDEKEMEKALNQLDKIKCKLSEIKQKEFDERQSEDADSILNAI